MENKNTYILNLEGSKLHSSVKTMEVVDKKKYKGAFDYSLEAIKVYNTSKELYGKKGENIFYMVKDKQYTDAIINVNFTYSIKQDVMITDKEGKIITKKNKKGEVVKETVVGVEQLRKDLYREGFNIVIGGEKVHFVKFLRSCGSSRQGKCLFIREDLYQKIMDWALMGLKFEVGQQADLPALEAYLALTASSIIDTVEIDPKSILVIKDCISTFKDDVMLTSLTDNGSLKTEVEKEHTIVNKMFDGQSLLDISIFCSKHKKTKVNLIELVKPIMKCKTKINIWNIKKEFSIYGKKSMLLLRNQFFKSNCISANIQKWFSDNNITDVKQLNGFTLASEINQIKLITTDSSLKITKFKDQFDNDRLKCIKHYLEKIDSTFGIVKYDKGTKYMGGSMIRTSYQFLNTVNMSDSNLKSFMKPTIDYINLIQADNTAFKHHLKLNLQKDIEFGKTDKADEFILNMMMLNEKFTETDIFIKFKDDAIENYKNNVKKGKVLIDGNYETLISNPICMLEEAIGKYVVETTELGKGKAMTKRFNYGEELLGIRSPHVCQGNIYKFTNTYVPKIDKYINLTENMVVINTVSENTLNILSSADMDSDSMLVTNSKQLCESASKYYGKFLVPTTDIEGDKADYFYTLEDMSKMDSASAASQQLIGEIVNLSMFLVSRLWTELDEGKTWDELQELYSAICELDICSTFAIDSSKKTFKKLDIKKELRKHRAKWLDKEVVDENKNIAPPNIQKTFCLFEDLQVEIKELKDYIKEVEDSGEEVEKSKKDELKSKKKELKQIKELVKGYSRKSVRPTFFKYIAKDKTIEYTYKYYNCTMDNICNLLPSQIVERPSVPYKLQLLQCFNTNKIEGDVDYRKKSGFIEDIKKMENDCKQVIAENKNKMEIKEIFKLQRDIRLEVIDKWKERLNSKTIHNIINEMGHSDEYNAIERKLVNTMYRSNKGAFLSIFKVDVDKEMSMLKRLYRDPVEDDKIIDIFGFNYVSVPVKRNMNIDKMIDINKLLSPIEQKNKKLQTNSLQN